MTNQDICNEMAQHLTEAIIDEYSYHMEGYDHLPEDQYEMLDNANIQVIVTPASN